MDEELPEATSYEHYLWDCPECQEVNDEGDIQPSGDMQCGGCGITVVIH